MKTHIKRIGSIVLHAVAAFSLLLFFSARWALTNWADLKMEELVYELQAPLAGTGNGMIGDYLLRAALPAGLVFAAVLVLPALWRRRKQKRGPRAFRWLLPLAVSAAMLITTWFYADRRLGIAEWMHNETDASTFIDEHYADPSQTAVTFPEKKRNLIYIYLESLELTFADEGHGGAFPESCIPELTELAEENEDFSGNDTALNGAISLPGTTWTMGAMFAETSGLPLKVGIGANGMALMEDFFPGVRTLGDILRDEGYTQTLMIGSDATFGGRRQYFETHGGYAIEDYEYARKEGLIPQNYHVFWGYEDEKLFAFAKEKLLSLAEEDAPFNLTLLTVDTHFEDGYVCRLCGDEFGDNRYANVFACSSRQVTEFVRWIMQQDFYEDTAIVLSGDHPTMDTDFCDGVPAEYQRKVYTCYINAASSPEHVTAPRSYSTFDAFPTTLAALGASIEGERLGLGTNLFSGVETLTEEYGPDTERAELRRKSALLNRLLQVKEADLTKKAGGTVSAEELDFSAGTLSLLLTRIRGLSADFASAEAVLTAADGTELARAGTETIAADGSVRMELRADPAALASASVSVRITDAEGAEVSICEEKRVMDLLGNKDLAFALRRLRALTQGGQYTLFLAVRDDGSGNLTEAMKAELKNLGLSEDLTDAFRMSYLAVVTGQEVHEELGEEQLRYDGTLPDGTAYTVVSAGKAVGRLASIVIGGQDYAANRRGYNLVLYDHRAGNVVGSMYFDLYGDPPIHDCRIEVSGKLKALGRIHVRVSEADVTEKAKRCVIAYWYEDEPRRIRTKELSPGDAEDYTGVIRGRVMASAPLHIQPYFINTSGSAKWYRGKEYVTEGGNILDRLLLTGYAHPAYAAHLAPDAAEIWSHMDSGEDAAENHMLLGLKPDVYQGVEVSLRADGAVVLDGKNEGANLYLRCADGRLHLPEGAYVLTDTGEVAAPAVSSAESGCYLYLEGWQLDEIGQPEYKEVLASLPGDPYFEADPGKWDVYWCGLRVPAGFEADALCFYPGIAERGSGDTAARQLAPAAMLHYGGKEKLRYFALFHMKRAEYEALPESDLRIFRNNVHYIYGLQQGCEKCVIMFEDGGTAEFET